MVFTVPSPCSFEEAMEITQSWLEAWEHGAMMPTDVVPQLTALLSSNEGVRGFFVIFLLEQWSHKVNIQCYPFT